MHAPLVGFGHCSSQAKASGTCARQALLAAELCLSFAVQREWTLRHSANASMEQTLGKSDSKCLIGEAAPKQQKAACNTARGRFKSHALVGAGKCVT